MTIILNGRVWRDGRDLCPTCLATTCDCPTVTATPSGDIVLVNGAVCLVRPDGEPECVYCGEYVGGCHLTGGHTRCPETHEYLADMAASATAPTIHIRAGGAT